MGKLSIWRRAFLRLRLKRKRNLVLILLLAVLMGSLIYCGLIMNYAKDRLEKINQTIGKVLMVTREDPSHANIPQYFSQEERNWFQNAPAVEFCNRINECPSIHMKLEPFIFDKMLYERWLDAYSQGGTQEVSDHNCSVMGVTDSQRLNLFAGGSFRLLEGSHLSEDQEEPQALISRQVAQINGLSLGDAFEIEWEQLYRSMGFPEEKVTLRVAGIFACENPIGRSRTGNPASHWENQIFVTDQILEEHYKEKVSILYLTMDPEKDIQEQALNLQEAIKSSGLPGEYSVVWDKEWYQQVSTPFTSVISFLSMVWWILLAGLVLIMGILIKLFAWEKKKENWILYTMGEGKTAVLGQTMCEICMLLGVAVLVSLPPSMWAGQKGRQPLTAPYIHICNETIENRQNRDYFYSQGRAVNETLMEFMRENPWFLMNVMEE